jgi:hypothetical protein
MYFERLQQKEKTVGKSLKNFNHLFMELITNRQKFEI